MKKIKDHPARSAAIIAGKVYVGSNEQWANYHEYMAGVYLTFPTHKQVPAKFAKQAAEFAFGS